MYPVRCSGKDEEEKVVPLFSSSSLDAATTTPATDAALADGTKLPTKNGIKEEVGNKTAGTNGLFGAQQTKEVE